jgi:Zn-dependent protease
MGDDTPKVYRRLTLNPFKHLDVIGAICLALFHFGWAKPVPINPHNYKNKKLGVIVVSLAGPISNLILAFLATVVWIVFAAGNYYLIFAMQMLAFLNLGLAVFNLIPIPPLDGSRILSVFLSERARNKYNSIEKYGVIFIFVIFLIPVLGSLFTAILDFGVKGILKGYIFIISKIVGLF